MNDLVGKEMVKLLDKLNQNLKDIRDVLVYDYKERMKKSKEESNEDRKA